MRYFFASLVFMGTAAFATESSPLELGDVPLTNLKKILSTVGGTWPTNIVKECADCGFEGEVYTLATPIHYKKSPTSTDIMSISYLTRTRYFNGNTKTWETSNMRTYSKVSKGMFEVYKDLLSTYLNNTVTAQNNDYTLRFTIKKEEKNNETLFEVLFGNTTCQSVSSVVIDSLDAPFATATLKPLLDLIKSNKSSIKATGGTENNSAVLGCSFEGITYNSMSLTSLVFSGYTIDKIAKLDKNMLELCEKQVPLPTSDPWEIFHTFYYATLFAKGEITLNKESNVCTFSRVIDQYYRQKTVCMKLYFA